MYRRHQKALRWDKVAANFSLIVEGVQTKTLCLLREAQALSDADKVSVFPPKVICQWLFQGKLSSVIKGKHLPASLFRRKLLRGRKHLRMMNDIIALSYIIKHVPVDLYEMKSNDDAFIKNLCPPRCH